MPDPDQNQPLTVGGWRSSRSQPLKLQRGGGLEADQVHAVLPADVPAVEPVDLVVSEVLFISGEPVIVTAVLEMFGTIGAFFRIRECKQPSCGILCGGLWSGGGDPGLHVHGEAEHANHA